MTPQEWIRQSNYDLETAEHMFRGGRYFYAVFMCHLAVEKVLKGLYQERHDEIPPRTHNLVFLASKTLTSPDPRMGRFVAGLNQASVATRYPEDLDKLQAIYTKGVTRVLLDDTRGFLAWIEREFLRP